MGRRRGLFAELQRQSAIQARERQRAQAAAVRQHAAALREAERTQKASVRAAEQAARADARAKAQAEKERKQAYLEASQARVAAQNASLAARIDELDGLLHATLERDDHIDFRSLKKVAQHPAFDPGRDAHPLPAPQPVLAPAEPSWSQFAPPEPSGMAKVFGGQRRQEKAVTEARARFDASHASWEQAERDIHEQGAARCSRSPRPRAAAPRAVRRVKTRYDQECADRQAAVDDHNREVDQFAAAVSAGSPEAVVEFFDMVLANSIYPDGFPQRHRVAYMPESAQLVVEYELPTIEAIPQVREYRYVKARGRDHVHRSAGEGRARSVRLCGRPGRVAHGPRTVRGRSGGASRDGRLQRHRRHDRPVHRAPGHPVPGHTADDPRCLRELDLARVEPMACLAHLNAGVSKKPEELAPVRPVLEFDMVDTRFVKESDVLGALDQRPNLMELTPTSSNPHHEPVRARWVSRPGRPRPSRDGGVDCVAYDPRPIFGGKVVIQAKRYKNTVDVSRRPRPLRHDAERGSLERILVTTSGYGKPASSSQGKPLELISGANLLYLLAEHAQVEARSSSTPTTSTTAPSAGRHRAG